MNISSELRILRTLGQGGEGTVYLMEDGRTRKKYIRKLFHETITGTPTSSLREYAARVSRNNVGLPVITLLEDSSGITGVEYPYQHFYHLNWRLLYTFNSIARALFGAWCQMQIYLLEQAEMAIVDADVSNFMLSPGGKFNYIDFGYGIKSIHHPVYRDRGLFGYAFTMLLLSIYRINIKKEMLALPGYRYDVPCIYLQSKSLDRIMGEHAWLRPIIEKARSCDASIFLDSEFYRSFTGDFPDRVHFSELAITSTVVLSKAGNLIRRGR